MTRDIRGLLFELGCALEAAQRRLEAIEAFERARAEPGERPTAAELLCALARVREASGELGKAFRAYAEAMLAAPEQLERLVCDAHRVLEPLVALQQRDWLLDTWLAGIESSVKPRERSLALVLAVRVALFCDDTEQAIEELVRASRADVEAAREAIDAHLDTGKLPTSLAADDARSKLIRARLERGLGRLERALKYVDEALSTELGDAKEGALRLAAELLETLGRTRGAAVARCEAGRLASERDDYQTAVEDFTRAHALDPELAVAAWELVEALRLRGGDSAKDFVDQAIAVWSDALARNGPPDSEHAWAYISRALLSDRKAQTRELSRATEWELMWECWTYVEAGRVLASDQQNAFWLATSARCMRVLDLRICALELARQAAKQGPARLSALDELSASLANLGYMDEAAEAILRRRELRDEPWCRGVSAYIALFQDRLLEALAELDVVIAEMPESESFWHRELRANAHIRAGSFELAHAEFEWIWTRREIAGTGDALTLAWAACACDSLAEGLRRFNALADLPQLSDGVIDVFAGLCELYLGDDRSGARVRRGIARVLYASELEAVERFSLPLLATRMGQRPEVEVVLAELREGISARRRELQANPPTALDELRLLERRRAEIPSRSVGEDAGLLTAIARFSLIAKRWIDAITSYDGLLTEPERFAPARVGLQTAVTGLVDTGFELAVSEPPERVLAEAFDPALEWIRQLELPPLATKIYAGVAHMAMRLGDDERARRSWRIVVDANPELGEFLADCHQRLLAGADEYWSLDEHWVELGAALELDDRARKCLDDARARLSSYLDQLFGGLGEPREWAVAPIELALSSDRIPAAADGWSLLTTELPALRERVRVTTGVTLPGMSVRDNPSLPANSYMISLFEIPLKGYREIASEAPALDDVVQQLETSLRERLDMFVRIDDAANLLETWTHEDSPERVRIMANPERRVRFARLLRQLVHERVSLVDGEAVVAAIASDELLDRPLDELVELARRCLRRWLPGRDAISRHVRLPEACEAAVLLGHSESGDRARLELSPEAASEVLALAREDLAGREDAIVVVREPRVRASLARLLELEFPGVCVLAADELEQTEVHDV